MLSYRHMRGMFVAPRVQGKRHFPATDNSCLKDVAADHLGGNARFLQATYQRILLRVTSEYHRVDPRIDANLAHAHEIAWGLIPSHAHIAAQQCRFRLTLSRGRVG